MTQTNSSDFNRWHLSNLVGIDVSLVYILLFPYQEDLPYGMNWVNTSSIQSWEQLDRALAAVNYFPPICIDFILKVGAVELR